MADPTNEVLVAAWRLRFGDPDALGWATTGAYFLAALLCASAGRRESRRESRREGRREGRRESRGESPGASHSARPLFWFALAACLALLGVNKQLDLQILLRDAGLALVRAAGYDEQRRWVGRTFVALVAVAGLGALALAVRYIGRAWPRYALALLGVVLLGCFLVLRTGMYAPVLRQINERHGWVLHVALELGSLLLISVAAARARVKSEK